MYKFLILITLIPIFVSGYTPFKQCPNKPAPTVVRIDNCEKFPCRLVRGKESHMEMDFSVESEVLSMEAMVYATVLGVTVPFELPDDRKNGCDWLIGSRCPLDASEDVTYVLEMPVLPIYPKLRLDIEVSLVDKSGKAVACFSANCIVVDV